MKTKLNNSALDYVDGLEGQIKKAIEEQQLDESKRMLLDMRRVVHYISQVGTESVGAQYRRKFADLRSMHHSATIDKYFVIGD